LCEELLGIFRDIGCARLPDDFPGAGDLPPSRFITVTPADNLFLYVYQYQGHMHGLAQPIEEFRAAKVIQVISPDILPSLILLQQRPLIAIPQPEIIMPASRIIRVPLADVVRTARRGA